MVAKCYDRDGNEDVTRIPCSQDGNPAQCCGEGEYCASNGLCGRLNDDGMTLWQNTCSVQDWINGDVETCPTQCAKIRNSGNGVTACGTETFCCTGYRGCDCNNSTQTFSMPAVEFVVSSLSPESTSISSTSTSATTTSTGTTTSSPTTTPTGGGGSTSDSSSDSSNLGIGLGVGLGVGIPLVLGAIAAVWFFRRRKRPAALAPDGMPNSMEAFAPTQQDKRVAEVYANANNHTMQAPMQELPATRPPPAELQ